MNETGPIPTKAKPRCFLCSTLGEVLYDDLEDSLVGVAGRWRILICKNCELSWLDPAPVWEALPALYEDYYTHDAPLQIWTRPWCKEIAQVRYLGEKRVGGRILSLVPPLRELVDLELMTLGSGPGKVLDVGCGHGAFMSRASEMGWEPYGVEPDEDGAARAAERFGPHVVHGTVETSAFQPATFDAITLGHVIEHVPDPVATLERCRELLRPGGKLVLTTPNMQSLGHRWFASCWRGLEPPRHIHLFSPRSLRECTERARVSVVDVRTPARGAFWLWRASATMKRSASPRGTDTAGEGTAIKVAALLFWGVEFVMSRYRSLGEELLLVARR